jgi:D-amino-acid dehydrogenase
VARDLLPGLEAKAGQPWMGHRPGSPDGLPLIGPAPGFGNLWLAAGHGQVGLALAAGTAAMVAALVAGERAPADPAPYAPARFA